MSAITIAGVESRAYSPGCCAAEHFSAPDNPIMRIGVPRGICSHPSL
jgi:hypothetical protein